MKLFVRKGLQSNVFLSTKTNKLGYLFLYDKYTVHSALNHIDETMKVTDIYIERDFKIENEANLKVLQYVFGSEELK